MRQFPIDYGSFSPTLLAPKRVGTTYGIWSLSLQYQLSVRHTVANVWRKERLGKAIQQMLTWLK